MIYLVIYSFSLVFSFLISVIHPTYFQFYPNDILLLLLNLAATSQLTLITAAGDNTAALCLVVIFLRIMHMIEVKKKGLRLLKEIGLFNFPPSTCSFMMATMVS